MKRHLGFLLFLIASTINFGRSQICGADASSPKTIVETYWQFEIQGGRLTSEGWQNAASCWVRQEPSPVQRTIVVISSDYSVWEPWIKGNKAQVGIGLEILGEIDPQFRFKRHSSTAVKEGALFTLVRTDFQPDARPSEKASSQREWRIEAPDRKIWLVRDAALRYLNEIQGKTSDPSVKANAERSIAILKNHR